MFIADAFAQGSGGESSIITSLAPIIIIFAIFYFIVIAPQRKKQKMHEAKVSDIGRGSKIITGGGLYGTVQRVIDHRIEIVLEGDNVKAIINRASIASVLEGEPKKPASKSVTADKNSKKAPAKAKKTAESKAKKKK